jgi:RimJ/RimL family protein N-acetyltransferase
MDFLDSLFGKKPTDKDKMAFNYYLFFDYLPKRLHEWANNNGSIQNALSFGPLALKDKIWKPLIKEIKVTESSLKNYKDVILYLIQAPSNKRMGEVAMAIAAVSSTIHKFQYFTMEYSIGGFAICTSDEKVNHYYMADCKDGEQFGAYVIKQAMDNLIPASAPQPKVQPKPTQQPKPALNNSQNNVPLTAETFLKRLETIADNYYKERGVVSLEDWMVTQKTGDTFKFYITQYPDAEFDDPNCEVTLMVDFMDHNGRMEVVNKFFPKKVETQEAPEEKPTQQIPNILGKYFSLEQLTQEPMGQLRLQPIDAGLIFNEQAQSVIQIFAEQSPRIKKYFPNLDLSSNEKIADYFIKVCNKTELGYEFGYSIKMNSAGDAGVIGIIIVHTPAENELAINFPNWTIDFFLFEPLEGKGIMRNCLLRVMNILKNRMSVEKIYAIVDEHNTRSLKLLFKLPFDCLKNIMINPATGERANVFCCDLTTITFQKQNHD